MTLIDPTAAAPNTIDDYIDDAKRALDLSSDRELDRWLGFKGPAVSAWRTRRSWPADESMARIAEAGGHDARLAVCHLHQWSATTPKVRDIYQAIAKAVASAAAAVAMLTTATVSAPANATATIQPDNAANYILCALRRRLHNAVRRALAVTFVTVNQPASALS